MLKVLLCDLDNTLYPRSLGLFDRVADRIRNYMEDRLGYEKEVSRELRLEYVKKYGSTLRGLMIHQKIDPADFLEYVHDVGVEETVRPNPSLGSLLQAIPIEKAIFTSGHRPYALKVLRCLGVEKFFPQIFDIIFTQYIPKPNPEPYHQILDFLGASGSQCLLIDDMPANLKPAKELGMTTVLVRQNPAKTEDGQDGFIDYRVEDILEMQDILHREGIIKS
jgi:putative hydrolase of the HAD superfamily